MIFVFLYYEDGTPNILRMKTFTKEQKDEALEWHRKNPKAISLIGSGPMPENYVMEILGGNDQGSSKQ